MSKTIIKTSKFLSLVLRHNPGRIGLTLDAHGWADVDELLARLHTAGHRVSRDQLDTVVRDNDKQRFAFSDDGTRIRASQGHSVDIDLGLQPIEPPEWLYHGTATRFAASIRESGLHPRSRQHVHLSLDRDTAVKVGGRHGVPHIFRVAAAAMHAAGHSFYRSANGVWLTPTVPTRYIDDAD